MKDAYGREINYLRLSITESCNLRCRYCMPEDGGCCLREVLLTEDEMILAVKAAASLGVTKLRITGGEPLMAENVLSICSRAAAVPGIRELCLTTNGTRLRVLAPALRKAGVRRVNVSIDTLNAEKYAYITRRGRLSDALDGLHAALEAGFDRVKINTVLIGGWNDDEIADLAALSVRYPVDVRFIELMPMREEDGFGEKAFVPNSAVLEALPALEPLKKYDGVSKLYRLPGAKGSVGLISPVSERFCASCNRLRLTADGKLKPCLLSPEEYSVKGLDFDAMREQMERAIREKPRCHGALSSRSRSRAGRNMNEIGG